MMLMHMIDIDGTFILTQGQGHGSKVIVKVKLNFEENGGVADKFTSSKCPCFHIIVKITYLKSHPKKDDSACLFNFLIANYICITNNCIRNPMLMVQKLSKSFCDHNNVDYQSLNVSAFEKNETEILASSELPLYCHLC